MALGQGLAEGVAAGWGVLPGLVGTAPCGEAGGRPGLAACADQGIAVAQLQAKPGDVAVFGEGTEPEGDLGQFDRDRVEVDAEDVVVGQIHLDALLGAGIVGLGDALVTGGLSQFKVFIGELVNRFVDKGRRAHGRFADLQAEQAFGAGGSVG